jgi:ERCC4-related helicase
VTRDDEDRPIVTVLTKSDQTVLRRVTLGLSNNKQVEIVKNLRAGDRVVLAQSESQGEEGD